MSVPSPAEVIDVPVPRKVLSWHGLAHGRVIPNVRMDSASVADAFRRLGGPPGVSAAAHVAGRVDYARPPVGWEYHAKNLNIGYAHVVQCGSRYPKGMRMATQKRAEVTRRVLLHAAAEVFTRRGYADTKLNEILTLSPATKGALYFHYGSKEELARAVIEEGTQRFTLACTPYLHHHTPAFEAMIGVSFVTVDAALNDAVMGATFRLITEMGDYRSSETDTFATWISTYQLLARRAVDEGDMLADTDPDSVGQLLVEIFAGARLLATATDNPATLPTRTALAWDLLLPVLVTTPKVDYFRQFVVRRLPTVGG
ncbi:A-factor receptor protein (plasmid) [Rhodococcus opacus PD630]|nr:A-factor receptor protein [Rhodococcus opacus PD630]